MANTLTMESIAGLQNPKTYSDWASGVRATLTELTEKMEFYRGQGYRLIGYGAAAKGMTLLNAAGLDLDVVIDDNPLKQGTWCPGRNTPVVSVDYLDTLGSTDRAVFIPLAWNFFDEIRKKIISKRESANDRFVRYFPRIEIQ